MEEKSFSLSRTIRRDTSQIAASVLPTVWHSHNRTFLSHVTIKLKIQTGQKGTTTAKYNSKYFFWSCEVFDFKVMGAQLTKCCAFPTKALRERDALNWEWCLSLEGRMLMKCL